MEPPRLLIQSCGGAPAVSGKNSRPVVTLSSTTMAFSGRVAPRIEAMAAGVIAPLGSRRRRGDATPAGARARAPRGRQGACAELSGERLERVANVLVEAGELGRLGILRHEQAGLVGIGEEGNGLARPDQDQVTRLAHHAQGPLDDIGNALNL